VTLDVDKVIIADSMKKAGVETGNPMKRQKRQEKQAATAKRSTC
jgi:hypothetical protein